MPDCTCPAWGNPSWPHRHGCPVAPLHRKIKSQARLRLRKPAPPLAVMLRVNGKPFRCPCGANVFTQRRLHFTCNACGERYGGV